MRLKSCLMAVLMVALASAQVSAQSVDEIIKKHADAIGGKDKLAAVKSIRMKVNAQNGPMEVPVTITKKRPGMMYTEVTLQGMSMKSGFDGKAGWTLNPFSGKTEAEAMPEEQLKEMKDEADIDGVLLTYKEKGYTAELIGKEDMEGTEVNKIKVTKTDGSVETYYIDSGSNMILKITSKVVHKGKETEGEVLMGDYKSVEGLMFPFSMENREVGAPEGQKMTMEKVEINPEVDNNIFKMPAASAAKPATEEKK